MVPFLLMALCALTVAAFMVKAGVRGLQQFPAEAGDIFRYVAGFLPLGIATLIVLIIVATFLLNYRRRIGICATHFVYSSGYGKPITIPWSRMAFSVSHKGSLFSCTVVTGTDQTVSFERFFFLTSYDEVCAKLLSTKQGKNDAYKTGIP